MVTLITAFLLTITVIVLMTVWWGWTLTTTEISFLALIILLATMSGTALWRRKRRNHYANRP